MNQKVSVILPLYNRIALVEKTIKSVQSQTYPYWEAIVVDDGSTDGSYELVEKINHQDKRIRLAKRSREPKGAPTCRNIGATLASGDYLIFLDSDDLLAPLCLEQRIAAFQQFPDYDFLVFPMLMFKKYPHDQNILWNVSTQESDLTRFLRVDAVWQTTGPMYQRTSFLASGGFDEGLRFWQDYELHTRLLISGSKYKKFLNQVPDCFYRQHIQGTISQAVDASEKRLTLMEQVFSQLYRRLQRNAMDTTINKKQIAAMYFWINMAWIEQHVNFAKSKENWLFCYQQRLVSEFQYVVGYSFFFLRYWQRKTKKAEWLFRVFAKPFVLMLPEVYRNRSVMIAKVKYSIP